MDIISKFSGYVGSKGLPNEIERAPELRLARRYNALSDELGQLKMNTIGSTYIDKSGALKVNQTSGLTALQARIAAKELVLEKLVSIATEIGAALEKAGAGSIHELHSRREEHANTLQSGPVRVWDQFRLHHERPPDSDGYPHLLPSDLVKIESYKSFEDQERAKMEAAKAALEPINEAITRVSSLVAEANGL